MFSLTSLKGNSIFRPAVELKPFAATAGALFGFVVIFALGECYLRAFPPKDLHPYLGDRAPGTGPFGRDALLGADYRDWDTFLAEYGDRLRDAPSRPHWALFGNSFVHMNGMLGDTATAAMPDRTFLYLGRNEPLPLRIAQVRWLLARKGTPGRIIFALMPLDSVDLAQHPLETRGVNESGVVTYRPSDRVAGSRLLLSGWLRFARPVPSPNSYAKKLTTSVPRDLAGQFDILFAELGRVSSAAGVPVTLLLIPTHEQITRGHGHAFQDSLAAIATRHGLDVCDVRHAYDGIPDKSSLFIPDKHFSPAGNAILLRTLRAHLGEGDP